jgi:hypothetical protein
VDNPEIQKTLGKILGTKTDKTTQYRKRKRGATWTQSQSRWWTQILAKGKQFLFLRRLPPLKISKGKSDAVIQIKQKDEKTKNDRQNTTLLTNDWAPRTPLTTLGEFRCSGRVNSSCTLLTNDWATRTPLTTLGELRCSTRVNSSCTLLTNEWATGTPLKTFGELRCSTRINSSCTLLTNDWATWTPLKHWESSGAPEG